MIAFDSFVDSMFVSISVDHMVDWTFTSIQQVTGNTSIPYVQQSRLVTVNGTVRIALLILSASITNVELTHPYSQQRIALNFLLTCGFSSSTVYVAAGMVVTPRAPPVSEAVIQTVSVSQAISVFSGDSGALAIGRLATSMSIAQCADSFGDDWPGAGIIPLSIGNGVVNTVVGNLLFVTVCTGVLVVCAVATVLMRYRTLDLQQLQSVMTTVFRFPSVICLFISPTLSSSLVAVAVSFRSNDSPGVYAITIVALCIWGTFPLAISWAAWQLSKRLKLVPNAATSSHMGFVQRGFRRNWKWQQAEDPILSSGTSQGFVSSLFLPLFEDVTVLWYPALDSCLTTACSVVAAIKISGKRSCVTISAVLLLFSTIMLAASLKSVFARSVQQVSNILLQVLVVGSASAVFGAIVSGSTDSDSRATVLKCMTAAQAFGSAMAVISIIRSISDGTLLTVSIRHGIKVWAENVPNRQPIVAGVEIGEKPTFDLDFALIPEDSEEVPSDATNVAELGVEPIELKENFFSEFRIETQLEIVTRGELNSTKNDLLAAYFNVDE